MNRDQIWQQLKDEKETIYGKKMINMFLSITEKLNINHLEEALDSGYEVGDTAIKSNIIDMLNSRRKKILLDKIIANKKDMSSTLMYYILNPMNDVEIKEMAPKMNLSKMAIVDIYNFTWLKIDNIELMHELFGDKLKQFDIKQIINLIKNGAEWKIDGLLDKIINILGGWKSIIEKMLTDEQYLSELGIGLSTKQSMPGYYAELRRVLDEAKLRRQFAEKIMEEKDKYKNAEALAQYFYPDIKK